MIDENTGLPAGLVKVDAPDCTDGWCLVEIGSALHKQYAPDDPMFAPAESEPAPKKKGAK
jgi:hypothetical protein